MNLQISLVLPEFVCRTLGNLGQYLEVAADWTRGRSRPVDIERAFVNGIYALWVVFDADDSKLYGFFATEVKQYPNRRMLCIQHCAIEPNRMAAVEVMMQPIAEQYAKDQRCSGIEFVGRPGWKRHAEKHGYKAQSVVYQRFFEEAPS